jgi:DNA-binding PadR family transcriptional regulator
MRGKTDVWQGTLALILLRTLGPLHGYGLTRRIEQTTAILARFLAPAEEA